MFDLEVASPSLIRIRLQPDPQPIHELDYSYETQGILIGRHYGKLHGELLRTMLYHYVLDYLRLRPVRGVLVDMSACDFHMEPEAWLEVDYFPRLQALGVSHQATVLSRALSTTTSILRTEPLMHGRLVHRSFYSESEALRWLRIAANQGRERARHRYET